MKHEYVKVNDVQTHLIMWDEPFDCNGRDVIICITGNPGIPDFYVDFCSELYKSIGLPVCLIGQAGHEEVPDKKSNILKGQEHLFNLEGQIKHKLALINNYIDKDSRIHLIGHSIGAWLILELINNEKMLNRQIASVNLLFPTLQKMAITFNGKFMNGFVRNIHVFLIFLFYLAVMIPGFMRTFLVKLYLKVLSLPTDYCKNIEKFIKPTVGEKVLFLAYNELDTVTKLNTKVIDNIKKLTNVIYSSQDNWAPIDYMDDLQRFTPEISLQKVDYDHAFVLKSSKEVADMVSDFILTKL